MTETEQEQAVLVHLKLSDDSLGDTQDEEAMFALFERFMTLMEGSGLGEFDGHEFGGGFCTFFFYGPSADQIFARIQPVVMAYPSRKGSYLIKRFGGPGSDQSTVTLAGEGTPQ